MHMETDETDVLNDFVPFQSIQPKSEGFKLMSNINT